jgi:hypothetical protein
MARSRARKTEVQTAPTDTETLPPGATDFDTEEYESAAHAMEASRASEQAEREFAAGHHHVENGERPKPQHAEQHAPSGSHTGTVERKKWTPPKDPFGFENHKAGENRVQLSKSEGHQAWVIRFDHNPNLDKGPEGETYSKENPHPVLKMLKGEGYRWGFDKGDDKGGWGKGFTGDAYGADHIEARRVLQQAADLIGHKLENGRIPD